MVKFNKLWKVMEKKGISQYQLIHDYGISTGQLDRIRQNCNITTNILDILCNILDCEVGDITEHIKDNNNRFAP